MLQKLSLLLLLFFSVTNGLTEFDLGGRWDIVNANETIQLTGNVPGGIYTDLQEAGILSNIYYRQNDIESRWVSYDAWVYSRTFNIEADSPLLTDDNVLLVFEGIDTEAIITINDRGVGTTSNMFIKFEFDVKSHLIEGENYIEITFRSPVLAAQEFYEFQAETYPVPPACLPDEYHGECHANHIRKMQSSFAWDWGPAFPSVGVWKPVYLTSFGNGFLENVVVSTVPDINENEWIVSLVLYYYGTTQVTGSLLIQLDTDVQRYTILNGVSVVPNDDGEFVQQLSIAIPYNSVRLWWPNGYGDQQLYDLDITFISEAEDESTKNLQIGFRTINLVQEPLEEGLTFHFEVNSVPIFAKGSNWIPANVLPERGQDEETVRFLLQSAQDANMNMLRVWGGGIYESDYFYQTADELGILIWQDFIFACSMYPVDETFLQNIRDEVRYQVRRLQYHPSIAIWAGNNENEAALVGNWYGTAGDLYDQYRADYVTLYVDNIREEVYRNEPSRTFLVSSPTNGLESEEEGYLASNPYDNLYGDTHFYQYTADAWDPTIYPRTRFASEYGFQSLPKLDTILSATDLIEDLNPNSEFLTSRQHHPNGYAEIEGLINRHLNLPEPDAANYFSTYIYYSQISQAMALKTETEFYRQQRSRLTDTGEGQTMGALYWQLNDVWQAPTWASIDFNLNWKMSHYYAKNFFAPVLITSDLDSSRELSLYVVSDRTEAITGATAQINVLRWEDFEPILTQNFSLTIEPAISYVVTTFPLDEYLYDAGCGSTLENARDYCFLYYSLYDESDSKISPDNFKFPTYIKSAVGTQPAEFRVSAVPLTTTDFEIAIVSDNIALFVWLDSGSIRGQFSDNGFLQVTAEKVVTFHSDEELEVGNLLEQLTVTSALSV